MAATVLHEFKKVFLRGDYEKCIFLLKEYLQDESNLAILERKCLKNITDEISDKCSSFSFWVMKHNMIICELLVNNITCKDYKMCLNKLTSLIFQIQGLPVTKEHLCLEFIMLYNYVAMNLVYSNSSVNISSDIVWKIISPSFERAQAISKNSKLKSSEPQDMIDNAFFLKYISLTNLSKLEKETLYYLCFSIGWLAMMQNDKKMLNVIIKATSNIQTAIENCYQPLETEKSLKLFATNDIFSNHSNDVNELFITCLALTKNNSEVALSSLEKISVSEWVHFILYIKSYIHFQNNSLTLSKKCCLKYWDSYRDSSDQLSSRFCNLLGCCFFCENELVEAQKWFRKATDLDSTFFLPEYNLSLVFLQMNKISLAIKLFQRLCEKSHKHVLFPDVVFQQYFLNYCSEMIFIEADYYFAHFYVNLESYKEAESLFSKLLLFLQQNKMQIFSTCGHERIPCFFQLLHVEGAYVLFQSQSYDKCLKITNYALQIIPFDNDENILLSDWIFDVIPSLANDDSIPIESSEDEFGYDSEAIVDVDFKKIGIYFQSADSSFILPKNTLMRSKFLHIITLSLKALVLYKTNVFQEALLTLSKARNFALKLLQEKINSTKIEETKSTMSEDKSQICSMFAASCTSDSTMEELFIDSITPIDEVTQCNTENLKKGIQNSCDMLLDEDDEGFQICEFKQQRQSTDDISVSDINFFLSQTYNNMAVFNIAQKEFESVDSFFKIASTCMQGNIDVLYNVCLWELKKGNFDNAQIHWITAKEQSSVIDNILSGSISTFPYTVSFEELDCLNTVLNSKNDISMSFDVNWDD